MDARRNQTYTGLYEFVRTEKERTDMEVATNSGYDMCVIEEQCAVMIEDILEKCNALGKEVIFLGDGVPVFAEAIKQQMKVPYSFAPAHLNRQSAGALASLAAIYYAEGKVQTAAEHAPEYLRLSQAERERALQDRT